MRKEKSVPIKFCPNCESENVTVDGSSLNFSAGAMICKDCGYKNIAFPEKTKIQND